MLNKPTPLSPMAPKIEIPRTFLTDYVCSWLKDQKIREDLTKRIKYKKQIGEYPDTKLINDQTISQEYFKIWMQQPTNKPLMRLAMHPLLSVDDQKIVDEMSQKQRNAQITLAAQLTAGTVGVYWLFLSRMSKFQRFFNDRNKNRFVNGFKKVIAIYAVLIGWQMTLTSHYQKLLPQKIHEEGLFRKYGIQFQEKNV